MALPLINGVNYALANVQTIIPILGGGTGVTEVHYSTDPTV